MDYVYPKYKEAEASAAANVSLTGTGVDGVFVALVTSAYTYSAAHEFYSDLGANVVGTDQELTAKTITNGVLDGAAVTFPTPTAGPTVAKIVLYRKNSGANTTWRLVACLMDNFTNLPGVLTGTDVVINWAAGGIVAL